ncbi:MAG TPA: DUF305 domain-containing protein [Acidimicrobiales bacterium]|jgi:uncharacterized protein (DUF305 family)|nr:DUF305 domain-containing protein [Acidimicrobiales bacterium]
MTRVQRIALLVALAFLVGSIGYAIGSRSGDGVAGGGSPSPDSADVGFLWDMIAHHEQALVMSQYQISGGAEPRVSKFAREIVQSQSYEIGLMEAYLQRWGQPRYRPDDGRAMAWMGHHAMATDEMPGMATETQLERLADATGRDVDALFLELMKRHHDGGVEMAEAGADRAEDRDVRELAARIARYQRVEVKELEMTRVWLGLPRVDL